MREEREFEIGGETYIIKPLGAIKGRKVLTRLLRALGGAVSAGELGAAVRNALESMDDEMIDFLCEAFGKETRIVRDSGQKPVLQGPVFDDQFAANYSALLEWLICCVQVNFPDFLEGAGITSLLERVGTFGSKFQKD